uniref:Uncharacterized protein n=1 Tax=Bubo bubo TaxID=30461 RepID=A0A8C0FML5_BUBBB
MSNCSSPFLFLEFLFEENKIRAWWRIPVVPDTREAEPTRSLEPSSSELQCAMLSGRPH